MRVVALEEHFAIPALAKRISPDILVKRGLPANMGSTSGRPQIDERLADFSNFRMQSMDESGIEFQVMGLSGVGADLLPPSEGPAWAREANDILADECKKHPKRYAGFAHLPLTAPEAAADELERCVTKLGFLGAMTNGTCEGLFLDDPKFEPVLARAEALGVPLYLHPGVPPKVIMDAYYAGLPGALSPLMARAGWGWHAETAVHVIRLVLSGALDRHPKLQLIIGHLGEGLQVMMDRMDETFNAAGAQFLKRKVGEQIRSQVHITTSGFFYPSSFLALLQTFGADRIMFSVDYPFADNAKAKKFLDTLDISPVDKLKIASGNADRLLKPKHI